MKKILAMVLSVAIIATLAISGTVAYLTDTDSTVNVMTTGNVFIKQYEQEREMANGEYVKDDDDNIKLKTYTNEQQIVPAVYDKYEKEDVTVNGYTFEMRSEVNGEKSVQNYVDKIVSVENTGTTDAYVRTIIAIPEAGDFDAKASTDPKQQWLHWNGISDTDTTNNNGWYWGTSENAGEWPNDASKWYYIDNAKIKVDGEEKTYDLIVATNKNAIKPEEITAPSFVGFYIDKRVDNEKNADGSIYYTFKNDAGTEYNLGDITDLKILVATQAVQANGFSDAWTALDDAFGAITGTSNPWSEGDTTSGKADVTISTADALESFRDEVNAGDDYEGKVVKLTTNIDLGGETWTPIKSFRGEFDGQGHTVSNFKVVVDNTNTGGGLFNVLEANSKVHDLKITNVEAEVGAGRFGTLANSAKGYIDHVVVDDVKVTTKSKDAWVGGLCAFMSWPAVNDCEINNIVVDASEGATFVAGVSPILQKNSNFTFTNIHVNGFTVNISSNDEALVAGFADQTQRGWETPSIANCSVKGIDITASGKVYIGGFIAAPGAHTTITNCTTEGEINASEMTKGFAGGFLGDLGWNCDLGNMGHKVKGCTATVNITTANAVAGGFVGTATNSENKSMYATFNNCTAAGNVTCSGSAYVGGFAGDADRGDYENCTVTGTVSGSNKGTFIGAIKDVTPTYDSRYPKGTRAYDVDQVYINDCGDTSASGFIGSVADGASVNYTAAPTT